MDFLGNFTEDSTVNLMFSTNDKDGGRVAPSSAFEADDVRIYKNNSATQKSTTNGITMTSPFDSMTGVHLVSIDTSNDTGDAGFWATGNDYTIVLYPDETVDSENVSKVLAQFSIENRFNEANLTHIDGQATSSNSASLYLKSLSIINSAGTALTVEGGSGGHGIDIDGNGAGDGISLRGGANGNALEATATGTSCIRLISSGGDGLAILSTGSNGDGISVLGNGTGAGVSVDGGATGNGIEISGGSTSGKGVLIDTTSGTGIDIAPTSGIGVNIDSADNNAVDISADGSNGNGIAITGNGSGNAVDLTPGSSGNGIEIDGGGASSTGIQIQVGGYGARIESSGGSDVPAVLIDQTGGQSRASVEILGSGLSGAGLKIEGGTNGNGVEIVGGSSSGDGIEITTTSGKGIEISPSGAEGIEINTSGSNGVEINTANSDAIDINATGSGASGMDISSGSSGYGMVITGNATNGNSAVNIRQLQNGPGINVSAGNNGPSDAPGIKIVGANDDAGIEVRGGSSDGNAIDLIGDNQTASNKGSAIALNLEGSTNGDAFRATGAGTGMDIYAPDSDIGGINLADDAITASKYDESTAFPVTSADSGSTQIARTGADGDTLETLSDQVDGTAVPGDNMNLADDAITASKYDESTAFPVTSADSGSTQIARTGADGDTLETLSDQVDNVETALAGTIDANIVEIGGNSIAGNLATLTLKQLDIQNNAGDAVVMASTGGNGAGLSIEGNGSGNGLDIQAGATGNGLDIGGGATSGNGIDIGTVDGHGIKVDANGSGDEGVLIESSGGNGVEITASQNGTEGVVINASGMGGHGVEINAGNTGGDGIYISTNNAGVYVSSGTSGVSVSSGGTGLELTGNTSPGFRIVSDNDAGMEVIGGANYAGIDITGGPTDGNGIDITGDRQTPANRGGGIGINAEGATNGEGVLLTGAGTGNPVQFTADGVDFNDILEFVMAMFNGKYDLNTPGAGDITFYKRDNSTGLSVVNVTGSGRTRTSP